MRRAPLLCMDVEIAAGNTARIEYYDGDDTAELAAEFCLIHDLDASLVCPRCKIATPPKAPAGGFWHLGDGDGGRLWHLGVGGGGRANGERLSRGFGGGGRGDSEAVCLSGNISHDN